MSIVTVREITDVRVFQAGDFTITLHAATGTVSVTSSEWPEMQGSHVWNSRGRNDLVAFIRGLDRGYVEGKLFAPDAVVRLDVAATRAAVGIAIGEAVADGNMGADDAEDAREAAADIMTAADVGRVPGLDAETASACVRTEPSAGADRFWTAWTALCAHLAA